LEDWALIRRLVADGVPKRQVARQLGVSRGKVDRALASSRPPKYERKPSGTSFDRIESAVRLRLKETR
jgi:DNA invertase Pin-like site-specific DNA recombinase